MFMVRIRMGDNLDNRVLLVFQSDLPCYPYGHCYPNLQYHVVIVIAHLRDYGYHFSNVIIDHCKTGVIQ